jgi:hypothetical protein
MTTAERTLGPNRGEVAGRFVLLVGVAGAWAAFGALIAKYLYGQPPSALVVAAGVLALVVLALAVTRYETAATLGFLLLGVVFVEPSPPDGVFAIVIAVAMVTGRFDPTRVPLVIGGLIGTFVTLNLMSTLEAVDPNAAA